MQKLYGRQTDEVALLPVEHALTRTKLIPPRLPTIRVGAARQARWLAAILDHVLCLVRAPSGYGKSTLCTTWLQSFERDAITCLWLSVEAEDDDPARFIPYIFTAIRSVGIEIEAGYDALSPPQSIATQFINSIHRFGKPLVFFLDDVDRLTDSRVLQFLTYVLLHAPPNLHVVAACQAQPALPLMFLETHDQLLRFDTDDLRLSDEEAHELLIGSGSLLTMSDVRRLNEAMGGWVTGLRIGSAALANNCDALFDIGLASHGARWLGDYLDENIFQHLTPVARRFLTRCAIVETLTADLCCALVAEDDAAGLLAKLADQNLFLQRLDDTNTRYRMHPVFREFLRTKLADEGKSTVVALHVRASDWYAKNDRIAEAIGHSLEAGQTERAAALISTSAMAMVERSDIVTLLGWIARLPESEVARHLPLRLAEAWALTLTLRPRARQVMDDLRVRVDQLADADETERLRQELAGIETIFLAVYEDRLDEAVRFGYDFLGAAVDEDRFVTRAVRNATAYCEMKRGNMHRVHDLVRPAQLMALRNEQPFTTAYRQCIIGLSYFEQGQLREAERVFLAGLEQAERQCGEQSASAGLLAAFAARCEYERGDIESAWQRLEFRLPVIDEAAFHEAVIEAYVVMIRIAALRGEPERAAAFIDHAELIGHERDWTRLLAICALERTRLQLPITTDLDRLCAGDTREYAATPSDDFLPRTARTRAVVAKSRCLEAVFADDAATYAAGIEMLRRYAKAVRSFPVMLKINVLDHAARARLDSEYSLDVAATHQLQTAVDRGFGRTVVDGLAPLTMNRRQRLLAPFDGLKHLLVPSLRSVATGVRPLQADTVFTVLTSREIDVLTDVGRGDSNKEIARRLHLTPETVKWHLKNVMRKLDADNRTDAVKKAAALGLSLAHTATN